MAADNTDNEDTIPVVVSEFVVLVAEVYAKPGMTPMLEAKVFKTIGRAEAHCLALYDQEDASVGVYLCREDGAAARERWRLSLMRGRPVHLAADRTIRLRSVEVEE